MNPALPPLTTTAGAADDGGPKDPTTIVKGKRTKRQRQPSSSLPFTIVTHSSTSYNNAYNSSPASSSDFPTTAEDEDTANCLILLSKGRDLSSGNNHEQVSRSTKFISKRYIQTSTDDVDGLTGIYVYECKTCSRTFPSFQALGGHRASHKKPRVNELDHNRKPPPYTAFSDEEELSPQFPSRKNNSSSSSSLSLQLHHRVSSPGNSKKSSVKLHECSICGTEFNSGQALGGHMRRHRPANTTSAVTATNTTLSLIPYSPVTTMVADDQEIQKSRNDGLCLDLDLNLPAPPETAVAASNQDQHRESSFKFTANQNKQQPAVHLSPAPTLVDCHY